MSSLNRATIMGNIVRDFSLKQAGQTNVCNICVATNEKWTGKDGQPKEKTEYHNVVVWDRQAENCAKYLGKGSPVLVEGLLETRSYEKDGVTKYTTEIRAKNVQFLGKRGDKPAAAQTEPEFDL